MDNMRSIRTERSVLIFQDSVAETRYLSQNAICLSATEKKKFFQRELIDFVCSLKLQTSQS